MTAPTIHDLPLALVFGNPDQPRKLFAQDTLEDLAESIRLNGLLQPIKVTPRGDRWMIVLGERRFRAHQLLGGPTIRAIIEDGMADVDVLIEAIVENGQRVDVHPLEEAVAYQACLDQGVTIEDLAHRLGLQQPWRVKERTCLLNLRPQYQAMARKDQLTRVQAFEMAQLTPGLQDRVFAAIRRGDCPTKDRLRSMIMVLQDETAQLSLLDASDDPTPNQRWLAKRLEHRVAQVADMLRVCTIDNEIVAVKKVDPSRADTLADLMKAMQGDLRRIEVALRATARQRAA